MTVMLMADSVAMANSNYYAEERICSKAIIRWNYQSQSVIPETSDRCHAGLSESPLCNERAAAERHAETQQNLKFNSHEKPHAITSKSYVTTSLQTQSRNDIATHDFSCQSSRRRCGTRALQRSAECRDAS
jgi:hypothetical protein